MNYGEKRHFVLDGRRSYDLKINTIKNCIFACDIEPSAVEIAKLRLWLSIVIDDILTKASEADEQFSEHSKPRPLPNLDCNIICGNSLVDEFQGVKLISQSDLLNNMQKGHQFDMFQSGVDDLIRDLIKFQDKLFFEDSHEEKELLKAKIQGIYNSIVYEQIKGNPKLTESYFEVIKQHSMPFVLWQLYFPKVFKENGGFDIVIGNPPYVSAPTQVADENLSKIRNQIIASKRYKSLYQKWDLYVPFMECGILLLKENGIMSMIVPYPLTNQNYARELRKIILQKNLIELVDLQDTKVFEATVQNCIPFVVNRPKQNDFVIISGFINGSIKHKFNQPVEKLIQDQKSFVWNLTQEERKSDLYKGMNVLGDFCYVSKGMVLNADEKKAKGEFVKKDLISETFDEIHPKKYIEAKDIDKFIINRVRYLEWGTKRVPKELSRPTFEELYTSKKLLFNCLGELKVSVDLAGEFYCEQAIRVAVPWYLLKGVNNKSIEQSRKKFSQYEREKLEEFSEKIELKYLLGIVNSKMGKMLLNNLRGGDYHIVPEHIRNIPIPLVSKEEQKPIIDLVDKILEEVKNGDSEILHSLYDELDKVAEKIYNEWKKEKIGTI